MGVNSALKERHEIDECLAGISGVSRIKLCNQTKAWDTWKAYEFIADHVSPQAYVLDAGTRECRILEVLYERGFRHLYGCDLASVERRRLIEPYIRSRDFCNLVLSVCGCGPLRLTRRDIHNTGYPSGRFDVVTCISVIEHGISEESFFEEMRRIIRAGGYLLLSTDYWETKISTSGITPYGLPWKIFDRSQIEDLVQTAGMKGFVLSEPIDFSVVEPVITWEDRHYTFLFFVLRKAL